MSEKYKLVSSNGYVKFSGTKEQCESYRKSMPEPSAFKIIQSEKSATDSQIKIPANVRDAMDALNKAFGIAK